MLSAIKNAVTSWINPQKEPHILMNGLDAAGKTTMMYKFRNYEANNYPTFNSESATVLQTSILSFDPIHAPADATHPRARAKRAFLEAEIGRADALVWVIDGTDPERFEESKQEFETVYNIKASTAIPILFLVNKQDRPNFVPIEQITNIFNLQAITNPWNIFPIVAYSGDNLYESFSWLLLALKDQGFKILHAVEPVTKAVCEVKPNQ